MRILNNDKRIVFNANCGPDGVIWFWKKIGKRVDEYSPMEFLTQEWANSSLGERPLEKIFIKFPFIRNATANSTIILVNEKYLLIPYGVRYGNDCFAWAYWQKMLDIVTPGHLLMNSVEP